MRGDFSRLRFSPNKNYSSVLQQQGRVALDADANEQCAINEHLNTTETVDVIGPAGGPKHDEGFKISIQDGAIDIGAGRYYVEGILCENEHRVAYSDQPFLIDPSPTDQVLLTSLQKGTINSIQVYLQVWKRLVTALDDECLREPALGQADTTARLQTVWRVLAKGLLQTEPLAGTVALTNGSLTVTGTGTSFATALATGQQVVFASDTTETPYTINAIAGNTVLTLAAVYAGATTASTTASVVEITEDCCKSMHTGLVPTENPGKLRASTGDSSGDCSCEPTPAAGYRGIENQLYRVEIHQTGNETAATFKWSRENGSVVVAVTGVSGNQVYVDYLGPDANLGFAAGQWVEISDDSNLFGEAPNQPGDLYQIKNVSPETLSVTVTQPVAWVDSSKNARMRRWDQFGSSAGANGVSLATGPLSLENGIEVEFRPGDFESGDYWLIPARTATGQIEWPPCGRDGKDFQPPDRIEIFVAPLACISLRDRKPFPVDCRRKFPPLTDITACDVSYNPRNCSQLKDATTVQQALDILCGDLQGPCTIVPKPGAGWEAPLKALKAGQDADICFPIGTFPLTGPLILNGLGSLRLSGGGPGTVIAATGVTAALIFANCKSVQVNDLYASADTVQIRNKRTGGSPPPGGTLSFTDCLDVSVENVAVKCGYAEERAAACITVLNSYSTVATTQESGTGAVRIRHCNLQVGRNQDGILLVRVGRAQVENNILVGYLPKKNTFPFRLQNRLFRANAIREFVSNVTFVKVATAQAPVAPAAPGTRAAKSAKAKVKSAPPLAPATNVPAPTNPAGTVVEVNRPNLNSTVTAGNLAISFRTHPLLKQFWQSYLTENGPKQFSTNRDLLLFMKKAALDFLLHPKLRVGNTALANVIATLEKADQIAMARGIAVGGEGVQECRILNNSINDAVQGITVGMSNHRELPGKRESASVVTIAGNQIYVGLPPGAQFHARHAIFVGNVDSLLIENNYAQVLANPNQVAIEGIRVWGVFGQRLIIRHCHLAGFNLGIVIDPLSSFDQKLWFVAENMAENSNTPSVVAPLTVTAQNNVP